VELVPSATDVLLVSVLVPDGETMGEDEVPPDVWDKELEVIDVAPSATDVLLISVLETDGETTDDDEYPLDD